MANWITDLRSFRTPSQFIAALQEAMRPEHGKDHKFRQHPDFKENAVCWDCGWLNPEGKKSACRHNVRDHVEHLLQEMINSPMKAAAYFYGAQNDTQELFDYLNGRIVDSFAALGGHGPLTLLLLYISGFFD